MDDKTVIRPGGRPPRRRAEQQDDRVIIDNYSQAEQSIPATSPQPQADSRYRFSFTKEEPIAPMIQHGGEFKESSNPIIEMLSPLISLASQVQTSKDGIDLEEFKQHAIRQIDSFGRCNFNLPPDPTLALYTSYGLCCLVDDLVLNTPWGNNSTWSSESLLVLFHKESRGGENFFNFLEEMKAQPTRFIHVLEFYYLALELGFEGRYRTENSIHRELSRIKQELFNLIMRFKPPYSQVLSERWEGISDNKNNLLRLVPQWVIWSVSLGLLVIIYTVFSLLLANQSASLIARAVGVYAQQEPISVIPGNLNYLGRSYSNTSQPDLVPVEEDLVTRLRGHFSQDIKSGLLAIEPQDNESAIVRLIDKDMFMSGSATASSESVAIIFKIGEFLRTLDVIVEVIGHTDDVPISSLKYPNNWKLSSARAETVKNILAEHLGSLEEISARGLADTQPLVPNNSAANRALNRRVELHLQSW